MNLLEVDESDCCGNGCANCILDVNKTLSKHSALKNLESNINCLHSNNFYELICLEYIVYPDIIKMKFQLKYNHMKHQSADSSVVKGTSLMLYVPPGHHIMMKTDLCLRPYSPFWIDTKNFQFEILINTRPNGIMSKYIKKLTLGDLVVFKGPIGTFYHEINEYDNLLIFSNGIAVTSVIRIIEQILYNEEDMTRIHYYGCFTDLNNFYFRENFLNYKQYWNFVGKIFLSREKCKSEDCVDFDRIKDGNCNNDGWCNHLKKKLKYKENIFNYRLKNDEILKFINNMNINQIKVIICGSKVFENFIKECLENCKVNKENIQVL